MCKFNLTVVAFLFAFVGQLTSVYGSPISTIATSDGMLLGNDPLFINGNRGLQGELYVGYVGGGGITKSAVMFSLASIPAGQVIESATLQLGIIPNPGDSTLFVNGYSIDVHRLLVSWIEGDGLTGANSGTTGITWNSRDKGGTLANWAVPGALGLGSDRVATPTATVGAANVTAGILSVDVTSDVDAWYTGDASNFGWVLDSTTVQEGSYAGFYSRNNEFASIQPTLVVTYSPIPEPSSLFLAALGGIGLTFCSRRMRNRA